MEKDNVKVIQTEDGECLTISNYDTVDDDLDPYIMHKIGFTVIDAFPKIEGKSRNLRCCINVDSTRTKIESIYFWEMIYGNNRDDEDWLDTFARVILRN